MQQQHTYFLWMDRLIQVIKIIDTCAKFSPTHPSERKTCQLMINKHYGFMKHSCTFQSTCADIEIQVSEGIKMGGQGAWTSLDVLISQKKINVNSESPQIRGPSNLIASNLPGGDASHLCLYNSEVIEYRTSRVLPKCNKVVFKKLSSIGLKPLFLKTKQFSVVTFTFWISHFGKIKLIESSN